jgi:hypothetical protein
MRPVQNVGHVPGRLSAASHVLRYGDRTASGTAGARSGSNRGVGVPLPAAGAAVSAEAVDAGIPVDATAAAPAPATADQRRKLRRLVPDRSGVVVSDMQTRFVVT